MSPAVNQITYLVKLQDRRQVAEHTLAFRFEKPEGFAFKAGQFIDMTLINPSETDGEGNGRAFSIASAPDESMLLVAARMRDTAFKRPETSQGLRLCSSWMCGSMRFSWITSHRNEGNTLRPFSRTSTGMSWRSV